MRVGELATFSRYLGIDYSGAATAESSLKGLRMYQAVPGQAALEIAPPPGPRKYWTRRGLAHLLADLLADGVPTLVGIDHGFSFPLRYFELHRLAPDWPAFLDDFQAHWPTDEPHTYVDFVREGVCGNGAARSGNSRWRRLCEERCRAKSVFHFDVQGSVAKSTHAGLPWLRFLRARLGARVQFWPFDGWEPRPGCSVIAEVYPSMWRQAYPLAGVCGDQQDAHAVASWLLDADADGRLALALHPDLGDAERAVAEVEGWILGVPR